MPTRPRTTCLTSGTWPIDFLHYPSYEQYVVAQAGSDWLQDGLGWLREAVGNGCGLYLWH
jgi:hypothetical protein